MLQYVMKIFIFVIITVPLISRSSYAQSPKPPKVVVIDAVTVTAARTLEERAVTKSKIDSLAVAQSSSGSLAELITKSTPAFVKTYGQGSIATISFRGTGASHTQVLWNGMTLNNPMLGQVDFSQIPMWFIDDVEVYHGGSSLHATRGALGGAISLETKPRWKEKYYGKIVQGVGSYGKYQTMVSAGGGDEKVQFRVRYLYERADNYFEFINTSIPPFERVVQTNAQYIKNAVVSDIYYRAEGNNFLTLNTWYHTSKRNMPTIMSYEGLGRKEKDYSDDIRVNLKWAKFWEDVNMDFAMGYSRTDMEYLLSNNTYLEWVTNTSSRSYTNSFFNRYNVDWNISPRSVLKIRANVDYYDVATNNRLTLEGYSRDRLEAGLSASFHYGFNQHISGYALLREEVTDRKLSPIIPSVGVAYTPFNDDKLYFAINGTRNYHNPSLNDLYWQPGGNPNLRQEQGHSYDMTAEYKNKWETLSFSINMSGYVSWIEDWIIWQPSEFAYWTAQNIQEVFSRGVEMNLNMGYNINKFDFNIRGNYAFTRTTNQSEAQEHKDAFGKQLIYIPLHKSSMLVTSQYRRYYVDFMWVFTGERFTTSSNEFTRHSLPYYSICDLTLGKKIYFGRRGNNNEKMVIDVQFKINNLFGVDYQAILWRAMPGRNYMLQLRFDF